MHKAMEVNEKIMHESANMLEKHGYAESYFHALSQALDNIKDIETIEAMRNKYQIEIGKDGVSTVARLKEDNDGYNIHDPETEDIVYKLAEHLKKYKAFKEEYERTKGDMDLEKSHRELDKTMKCMQQIVTMIHECVDSDEEKTTIKTHLRDMFNMYQ